MIFIENSGLYDKFYNIVNLVYVAISHNAVDCYTSAFGTVKIFNGAKSLEPPSEQP